MEIAMKKFICMFLVIAFVFAFAGCGQTEATSEANSNRDVIYQVSLLQGLTLGDYYGSVTVAELKKHGDIGIGTFDALDGELIMLDGVVYRAAGNGSVEIVPDDETIPFSNVTFMDADEIKTFNGALNYEALCAELNKMVEEKGKNRFYVIRIDGTFSEMNVRSEYAQEEPYKPLVDVLKTDQTFFDYVNVEGTVVGLYCPPYMSDLNAVGWHLHFVSKDKTKGGHVLGFELTEATLKWDNTDEFQMILPQNEAFKKFDLTVDQSSDIEEVEKGTAN